MSARLRRLMLAAMIAAPAAGCNDDNGGTTAPATLTGRWAGTETEYSYVLELRQDDFLVSGTGTENGVPLIIDGTVGSEGVELQLRLTTSGFAFSVTGTLTDTETITATTLRGGGSSPRPLVLHRQ
jgi:hypothetical protein